MPALPLQWVRQQQDLRVIALVRVGTHLLDSLLDHLINLVEPLLAKVAERLADHLVDVGALRCKRALAMTADQSTGAVRLRFDGAAEDAE